MARLLFTENGRQIMRNFTWLRVVWPDGRMSKPMEVPGTFILSTGTEPETARVLELVADPQRSAPQGTFLRYAAVFLLGMLFEVLSSF
jgi:hypothetical protein